MRQVRSPMIRLVERQLEPKIRRRTGFAFLIIFFAAFVIGNVVLNAIDMLSSDWQLIVSAAFAIGVAIWAIRRTAESNGKSVGEYLSQVFYRSGKIGW